MRQLPDINSYSFVLAIHLQEISLQMMFFLFCFFIESNSVVDTDLPLGYNTDLPLGYKI